MIISKISPNIYSSIPLRKKTFKTNNSSNHCNGEFSTKSLCNTNLINITNVQKINFKSQNNILYKKGYPDGYP